MIKSKTPHRLRRADFVTDRFLVTIGPDSTFAITRRRDGASISLGTNQPLVGLLFAFKDDAAALDSAVGWLFQSKRACHRASEPRHDLSRAMRPMTPPLCPSLARQLQALRIYSAVLRETQVGAVIARRAREVARNVSPRDALARRCFDQVAWHEAYRKLGRKIPTRAAAQIAA